MVAADVEVAYVERVFAEIQLNLVGVALNNWAVAVCGFGGLGFGVGGGRGLPLPHLLPESRPNTQIHSHLRWTKCLHQSDDDEADVHLESDAHF